MRFASIKVSDHTKETSKERMPTSEIIRRIVTGEIAARQATVAQRLQDLPADLDQRVRMVGEW